MASDRKQSTRRLQRIPEAIDHDLTPPPVTVTSVEDSESVPELKQQVAMLADAVGELWELRRVGSRLERIDEKIGTLARTGIEHQTLLNDLLIPGWKQYTAATDKIAQEMPRISAALEQMTITVLALGKQVHELEVELRVATQRFDMNHQAVIGRMAQVEHAAKDSADRIKRLEDRATADDAASKALSRRTKTITGIASVVLGFLSGLLGSFVK